MPTVSRVHADRIAVSDQALKLASADAARREAEDRQRAAAEALRAALGGADAFRQSPIWIVELPDGGSVIVLTRASSIVANRAPVERFLGGVDNDGCDRHGQPDPRTW